MSSTTPAGGVAAILEALADHQPGDRPQPLMAEERAAGTRVAERFCGEFQALVRSLPHDARSATGLARHIGVERSLCQRALRASRTPRPDVAVLPSLPGVRALHSIVEAAEAAKADLARVQGLRVAVDLIEAYFSKIGGSRAMLEKRLAAEPQPDASVEPGPSGADAEARAAFRSAERVAGRSCQAIFSITCCRPHPGDETKMETFLTFGLLGNVARPGAMPLIFDVESTIRDSERLPEPPAPRSGRYVFVPEFCSRELDNLVVRRTAGRTVHLLEPDPGAPPADVVMSGTNPALVRSSLTLDPPIEEFATVIEVPTRHVILDVYQHRSFAARSVPSADVQAFRFGAAGARSERWETRVDAPCPLEVIGRGLSRAAHPASPRHADLTRWVFGRAGWDPDDFVGFRVSIPYPHWRLGYRLAFDFTPPE